MAAETYQGPRCAQRKWPPKSPPTHVLVCWAQPLNPLPPPAWEQIELFFGLGKEGQSVLCRSWPRATCSGHVANLGHGHTWATASSSASSCTFCSLLTSALDTALSWPDATSLCLLWLPEDPRSFLFSICCERWLLELITLLLNVPLGMSRPLGDPYGQLRGFLDALLVQFSTLPYVTQEATLHNQVKRWPPTQ